MRLSRPPVIGPRAAGFLLLILGVTAFVLLGLLSPAPAEAEATSSLVHETIGCNQRPERDSPGLEGGGSACHPGTGARSGETASMVVQELGANPWGKTFFALAMVTLGGAILFEGRLRPGHHCAHTLFSRRQRV
jgi:hypothetical protein